MSYKMEAPKASAGHEDEMVTALLSLTALQGHVTRATSNLSETIGMDSVTAESITHAVNKLEKQLDKYIERQIEIAELCANEEQVLLLNSRVERTIGISDTQLRNAVRIKSTIAAVPCVTNIVRAPKKVTFRPLDHDNVQLWMRQLEDVFETMGIDGQLNRFTTLTTLLNDSEATVIQDITMTDPRPQDVFSQAKELLCTRYDHSVHERLTRAIAMRGFDTDESPSQWLARFRQTRGNCTIEDLDRWALIRHMPTALHPTLDALQPPPNLRIDLFRLSQEPTHLSILSLIPLCLTTLCLKLMCNLCLQTLENKLQILETSRIVNIRNQKRFASMEGCKCLH